MTSHNSVNATVEASYGRLIDVVARAFEATGRKVAVFDADGTLWRGDLGEVHLQHLGDSGPGKSSAHELYLEACREDVERGYRLGTQVLAPRSESLVYETCEATWDVHRAELFSYVLPLFEAIDSMGGEVWIVSASHRWIIEVAVRELGIPAERVIAGDLECIDSKLTSRVIEPFPNGIGKAKAIAKRIGSTPRVAFGNSRHDLPMLECAESAVLIWDESSKPESLIALSRERGWTVYQGVVESIGGA